MTGRKKILLFIQWFSPAFMAGGPVRSVVNLVDALKDQYEISVVTGAYEFGETTILPGIEADVWIEKDDFRIIYLSSGKQNHSTFKGILLKEKFDFVYFNSLFSFKFTLLPLFIQKNLKSSAKVILAPRGMLSPEALMIKPFKKRAFLALARGMGLFEAIRWHASTEGEAKDIRNTFPRGDIKVALNFPAKGPELRPIRAKENNHAKFLYVARIEENKNLSFAIEILSSISQKYSAELIVYGPVNNEDYYKRCQSLAAKAPSHVKVLFQGQVSPDQINAVYLKGQFLFVPSFSENFGHSIVEGFMAGLPAIISDNTPWKSLEKKKAGFDIPLSRKQEFIRAAEFCCAMDNDTYSEWSDAAFYVGTDVRLDPAVLHNNYMLFS